jgi:hypothetical protein
MLIELFSYVAVVDTLMRAWALMPFIPAGKPASEFQRCQARQPAEELFQCCDMVSGLPDAATAEAFSGPW